MNVTNPSTPEETAHHEAGHAVVARVLGAPPLKSISIVRDEAENSRGHCLHEDWPWPEEGTDFLEVDEQRDWIDAIALMAGPEAAQMFTGNYNEVGAYEDLKAAPARLDMWHANSEEALRRARARARALLQQHWAAVQRLAEELLEHKKISGPKAEKVIDAVLFGEVR